MRSELEKTRSDIEGYFAEREERGGGDFLDRFDALSLTTARHLYSLYHNHREWPQCMGSIFLSAAESFHLRAPDLRATDRLMGRDTPLRRQAEAVIGEGDPAQFGPDFSELNSWVPYFQELGLTHLHLTPSTTSDEPGSGPFSPTWTLGSLETGRGFPDTLGDLARVLRARGILLGADFVLNHTPREHVWAEKAREGDPYYRRFYNFFPDRSVPDQVEDDLRRLGVDPNPARFTHLTETGEWVWTTFSPEHWDLNYADPWVFRQMLEEMLALANAGPGVIRLKGGRFIWKEAGTSCQDLPNAGEILDALAALARMAAPGVLLRDADPPAGPGTGRHQQDGEMWSMDWEGFGMGLWAALAGSDARTLGVRLDRYAHAAKLTRAAALDSGRGLHWQLAEQDAARLGLDREVYQRWLADFYSGELEGSFSQGKLVAVGGPGFPGPRLFGRTASLAGVAAAQDAGEEAELGIAVRRVLLLHSVLLSAGVIPRLRLGDEVALLKDPTPGEDPTAGEEPGPLANQERYRDQVERRHERGTVEGRIFLRLRYLIQLRKRVAGFEGHDLKTLYTGDPALLGYLRGNAGSEVLCLANFSSQERAVSTDVLELSGLSRDLTDLVTGDSVRADVDLMLAPYQFVWLAEGGDGDARRGAGG